VRPGGGSAFDVRIVPFPGGATAELIGSPLLLNTNQTGLDSGEHRV